jgi:tetratricopeptide (TPR) repeat protein
MAFKSPNACNICHSDKDASWADKLVREWRSRDYQAVVIKRAGLIDAARKQDWKGLPEMLDAITSKDRDEVVAVSLIRLLMVSGDEGIPSALLKALKDQSPLVRSAAATALGLNPSPEAVPALLQATGDEYRVVRIRAAEGLAGYPRERLTPDEAKNLEKANGEYLAYLTARPDQWSSQYNLGNYYLSRGQLQESIASYGAALKLEPRAVMALVNLSMAYARMGEGAKAEEALRKALKVAPDNAAANFNMGLLKAEQKDLKQAEKHLRAAFTADPQMAQAAYNLCIIFAKDRPGEAVTWCRKAAEINPQEPRYAYTLAFYEDQNGNAGTAIRVLEGLIARHPAHADAYLLLGGLHEKRGGKQEAWEVYSRALKQERIPAASRYRINARLQALEAGKGADEPSRP